MVSADEHMPIAGSGQINGKAELPGKKAEKRRRKPSQKPSQQPEAASRALPEASEPVLEAREQAEMPVVSSEPAPALTPAEDISPREPAASEPVAASVQAITDAYGSYTKKSFEQTTSFFEQLAGARSLNRAFELQSEFAQAAFETFVDESRRIRELHRELAKQRLRSLEGFVMGRGATRST